MRGVDQGPLTGVEAGELQVCPSLATRPHGILSKWHGGTPVFLTSWLAGAPVSGCNGVPVAKVAVLEHGTSLRCRTGVRRCR